MSVVADLEAGLQAMLHLKPPGVSGSRIGGITTLCVNNVQSESVLIQKIYTHFKKTPGTHKLGVLYVVDSVTRKWLEQAKAQGQPINGSAQDGTFAAGVHRVTELMPVLMNDILSTAPEDQKEKIKKLVDIWEKGQTFPPSMLESFKQRLSAPPPPKMSTTPPGSPPANLAATLGADPKPDIPNIMQTLANLARQNNAAAVAAPSNSGTTAPPASAYGVAAAQASNPLLQALQNSAASSFVAPSQQQQHALLQQQAQHAPPPVNLAPGPPFQLPLGLLQPALPQAPSAINPLNGATMQANGFASGQPIRAVPPPAVESNIQQQLLLIQQHCGVGGSGGAPAAGGPDSVPDGRLSPRRHSRARRSATTPRSSSTRRPLGYRPGETRRRIT
jgi:protein NRD1